MNGTAIKIVRHLATCFGFYQSAMRKYGARRKSPDEERKHAANFIFLTRNAGLNPALGRRQTSHREGSFVDVFIVAACLFPKRELNYFDEQSLASSMEAQAKSDQFSPLFNPYEG